MTDYHSATLESGAVAYWKGDESVIVPPGGASPFRKPLDKDRENATPIDAQDVPDAVRNLLDDGQTTGGNA